MISWEAENANQSKDTSIGLSDSDNGHIRDRSDVTGKWTSSIETAIGTLNWSFSLKVSGDQVAGTATYEGQEVAITEGRTQGDTITFREDRELEGLGPIRFSYTGKIVSADQIDFHRKVGELAEEDFVAKRARQ
jgi:hypothetical protein